MSTPPDPAHDLTRVEVIFASIAGRPPGERVRVLEALGDAALRERVAALLRAHDRFVVEDDAPPGVAARPAVGDIVGTYRLLARLGAGGMGEVFRAERADGLFTQQVAVKFISAQVSHPDLLRRFAIERQILASLPHPNIVRMIDGGATAAGHAYLVMELLDGMPVTAYCRTQRLGLEARLRLFCDICGAVQHAHQHGVVHRDLKPANLLVGSDGVPKVVDFGIAKLLDAGSPGQHTMTSLPGPLTPNYASPEQLRGLPVTTVSDVYALGVVLYELLSGRRPYDTEGHPFDRVVQMVVADEPLPPSTAPSPAAAVPYPIKRLRGDLDAIVLKALSKEPEARYASAGELAADLKRWLSGDPVIARARSTGYVLRRLALRHRVAAATAAVALIAIVAALGVAAWQWQRARQAQASAEASLRDVRQLANSLIFKIHDAVTPLAGSTPVRRTIVDEALRYLERLEQDGTLDTPLRLELAAAHRQLGSILGNPSVPNLGDRSGAIAQYERARDLMAPLALEGDDLAVATAYVNGNVTLATLYGAREGRGLLLARETLHYITTYAARHPGQGGVDRLIGQALFSVATQAPADESITAWRAALEHYERMLAEAPDSADNQRNVALVGKYLGSRLEGSGDTEGARTLFARALALDERRLVDAPDSRAVQFDAAISYSNVASVSETLGDFETARRLFEKSLGLRRQLFESDPENVQAADRLAYLLGRMSRFHRLAGDPTKALEMAEQSVAAYVALHERTGRATQSGGLSEALLELGLARDATGRAEAACDAYHRAHRLYTDRDDALGRDARAKEAAIVASRVASCGRASR